MSASPAGRDVFVGGALPAADLAAAFRAAFLVPSGAIVLPGASEAQWLASLAYPGRIVIHTLAADGDFGFKLEIDLDVPIDTDRLVALARDRRLTIAWADDETSLRDDYRVAFPDGRTRLHPLLFRETEDTYACVLLPEIDSSRHA